MLTASVCFGLVTVARFGHEHWPRFLNLEMHRRVSLLSILFLVVHVLAAVFDPFAKLGFSAAIVPLASTYRPVPVALGVISMYLFIALVATGLLRSRMPQALWRTIHWSSYAMWPLAVSHSVLSGSDGGAPWMLAIDAVCFGLVGLCLVWRVNVADANRNRLEDVVLTSSWQKPSSRKDRR
jgi:sulfoxide reductase heme-binding subunit YedZ